MEQDGAALNANGRRNYLPTLSKFCSDGYHFFTNLLFLKFAGTGLKTDLKRWKRNDSFTDRLDYGIGSVSSAQRER
jgi:hypothetical protein